MRSLFRCPAAVSVLSPGTTSVGVAVLVSTRRSFLPMAMRGTGWADRCRPEGEAVALEAALVGRPRGAAGMGKVVCSGCSIWRCWREREIWRMMDASTGVILLGSFSSSDSFSEADRAALLPTLLPGDDFEESVCADEGAGEANDGERLLRVAVDADESGVRSCCCEVFAAGLMICHSGSLILCRTVLLLMISGEGSPRSLASEGESRMSAD